MNAFEAMMILGEYFNKGDGKNADQEVKDAWNGIRDFATIMLGGYIKEENKDDV